MSNQTAQPIAWQPDFATGVAIIDDQHRILIKNACEAAPERSKIVVKLQNQSPLRIVIQNHGAVPPDIRKNFFDKFVTKGKQDGTGLGTYSARLLTEAQGGKIELEVSDETDTTLITVVLPRAGAA